MQAIFGKKLIILTFLFLSTLFSFSNSNQNIISLIGEKNYVELKDKGEISVVIKEDESPTILPSISEKNIILSKIRDLHPAIGIELLCFFNTKDKGTRDENHILLAMYNKLRSISTLNGIMYFSASRNKDHILYHNAYIIDAPKTKNRIKDPVFHSIPSYSEVYAYFKDSSLGSYSCLITYQYNDNVFIMSMENITSINYLFLPIVQPHGLLSYIIILPYGDEIVFYGFSCLKISTLFGMHEGKIVSLYNRIKAIYQWFKASYHEYE